LQSERVIAIKFINKQAFKAKGNTEKDAIREAALHSHCSPHPNVIKYYGHGDDRNFYWIAMEWASGGDLFDKIEPDQGVDEDVAHLYFTQLINGVGFLHSRGVAHRDIKPENILLDANGNLKIGDFGLAALFRNPDNGRVRKCYTPCGSPPYLAPEVLRSDYDADRVDIWSSGVVLYVLFCGTTPWDEPLDKDPAFGQYLQNEGRFDAADNIPFGAISLLRGMIRLEVDSRFTIDDIRRHPWFTRTNSLMATDGSCRDPISLATNLISRLKVDRKAPETMMTSSQPIDTKPNFDLAPREMLLSLQSRPMTDDRVWEMIAQDPGQLQFTNLTSIPESMSQRATRFVDLVPPGRFTRFYTIMPFEVLVPILVSVLTNLNARVPSVDAMSAAHKTMPVIPFAVTDRRRIPLVGRIRISRVDNSHVFDVNFFKEKGDPLEWRYLFKRMVKLCPPETVIGQS
jgi:serine/threonine-protein kinase Chk1